jgi:release factor glutamine methyltransferase
LRENAAVTVHGLVMAARARFREAGIPAEEADLDARLLAQHLLGWTTAHFLSSASGPPPPGFSQKYDEYVRRRSAREPVAYLIGQQEFWGLTFEVSDAVLIPRPETEQIVEAALELFPAPTASPVIADVGTGSGCLAVALAYERPNARLVATDLSHSALQVAHRNATRHGVADRVWLAQMDLLQGLSATFHLIVCNPPYVPSADLQNLPPEVREFEPTISFAGGHDGLAVIRRFLENSVGRLAPGGVLIFEFGFGQADAVAELISSTVGLTMTGLRPDLQGIPRTALATHV